MFHTIGQDEAQAWNIAMASQYPWDVAHHGAKEGHTPLWHGMLWFLTGTTVAFTPFFTAMCAAAVAAMLLKDRPFHLWVLALALAGYFLLYDYSTIPRPYTLALLFSGILASYLYRGGSNAVVLSLLVSSIAFTSSFGILLSVPLACLIFTMLERRKVPTIHSRLFLVAVLFYFSSVLAAIYFIVFPIDNAYSLHVLSGGGISKAHWSEAVVSSAFPHYRQLPFGLGFWLSKTDIGRLIITSAGVVVVASVFALLYKRQSGVLAWLVAVIVISVGCVYSGTGTTRHLGHLFLAAFTILWATGNQPEPAYGANKNGNSNFHLSVLPSLILVTVLSYHAAVGLAGSVLSVKKQQTVGKTIAEYIQKTKSTPYQLITNNIHDIGHLVSYLNNIRVYDSVCGCWKEYADMSVSRDWEPENLFNQWCGLYKSQSIEYALITTKNELPFDSRFEIEKTFSRGRRDNSDGDFQLWRISAQGERMCD